MATDTEGLIGDLRTGRNGNLCPVPGRITPQRTKRTTAGKLLANRFGSAYHAQKAIQKGMLGNQVGMSKADIPSPEFFALTNVLAPMEVLRLIARIMAAAVVLVFNSVCSASAQDPAAARVEAAFKQWVSNNAMQSASLALVRAGEVVHEVDVGNYTTAKAVPIASLRLLNSPSRKRRKGATKATAKASFCSRLELQAQALILAGGLWAPMAAGLFLQTNMPSSCATSCPTADFSRLLHATGRKRRWVAVRATRSAR